MKKTLCIILSVILIAAGVITLCACDNREVILIWGASDHEDIYLEYAEKFREAHIDELKDYKFEFAGSASPVHIPLCRQTPARAQPFILLLTI